MKRIFKVILVFCIFVLFTVENAVNASMADYTDKQADQQKQQTEQELKEEMEERVNKSSNNYLKRLSVKNYELTPNFDKQTINYEIKKNVTENYIELEAETDDKKSSVSGTGRININSGDNNLKIDVTAENGTVRSYFIKINKGTNNNTTSQNNIVKMIIFILSFIIVICIWIFLLKKYYVK